jgi:hypothetical protein
MERMKAMERERPGEGHPDGLEEDYDRGNGIPTADSWSDQQDSYQRIQDKENEGKNIAKKETKRGPKRWKRKRRNIERRTTMYMIQRNGCLLVPESKVRDAN